MDHPPAGQGAPPAEGGAPDVSMAQAFSTLTSLANIITGGEGQEAHQQHLLHQQQQQGMHQDHHQAALEMYHQHGEGEPAPAPRRRRPPRGWLGWAPWPLLAAPN